MRITILLTNIIAKHIVFCHIQCLLKRVRVNDHGGWGRGYFGDGSVDVLKRKSTQN